MEKYHEMAAKYFHTFEGRKFYPKLLSLRWACWLITGIAFFTFIGTLVWFRTWPWMIPMYTAEVLFILSSLWIENFKWKRQKRYFKLREENPKTHLKEVQCMHLQHITQKPAGNFAAVVKEIADLRTNQIRFSPPKINYWRLVYDPDSKARLISITLASLALFVALVSRTTDIELPSILEFMAHDSFGGYLINLLGIAIGLYVIFFGIYYAYSQIKAFAMSWLARWNWQLTEDYVLEHFVTALVNRHAPVNWQ
ncbi:MULTISPECIES: hypothetical protein [Comamonas]|nr:MULTISPECIES: hypothetical protein [Comamonas]MPT10900.1 hypothetical protein [Comamonas sp.]